MALVAFLVLCACSSEQKELKYRGLSMALPFQTFIDSMQARGFAVDSAKTDSAFTTMVLEIEQEELDDRAPYAKIIIAKSGEVLDPQSFRKD